MAAWRYDQALDSIARFGPVGNNTAGNMADISPNGANAALVGFQILGPNSATGVAYRSNDGGRSYVPVTLPANTKLLRGLSSSTTPTSSSSAIRRPFFASTRPMGRSLR
jgi:hypothetical protein